MGDFLFEVCHNVSVELQLMPSSGKVFEHSSTNTSTEARVDVKARGFWSRREDAYFDVRVLHPNASSYQTTSPNGLFWSRRVDAHFDARVFHPEASSYQTQAPMTCFGATSDKSSVNTRSES